MRLNRADNLVSRLINRLVVDVAGVSGLVVLPLPGLLLLSVLLELYRIFNELRSKPLSKFFLVLGLDGTVSEPVLC